MDWPISWNDVKEALENGSGGSSVAIKTSDYGIKLSEDIVMAFAMGNGETNGNAAALEGDNVDGFWTALTDAFANGKSVQMVIDGGQYQFVVPMAPVFDGSRGPVGCSGMTFFGNSQQGISRITIGFLLLEKLCVTKMEKVVG